MKLYNTLTRKIEELPTPQDQKNISLYTCGPTVYDFTHIGHMRKYTMDDVLKRTLNYLGYEVKHVMNITDVGHLSGDDDSGEDKLEKGAKKYNKTVWDVAQEYTDFFFKTVDAINIERPDVICKATDHIESMTKLIEKLEEKGFTYETDEAVYFDVTKFPNYGKLSGQKLEEKLKGVREEVYVDAKKKHPADFSLWFKTVGRFADHAMHWPSKWGEGFPGWHIECSAMSMEYLGETIDIHTGGTDHIPVHHENEIAQSEAATGKQFVKYWLHHNMLNANGEKMSKSKGNFYTIEDVEKKGIDPKSLRLLFLQTHYRQVTNFTWEAAEATNEAYKRLLVILNEAKRNEESHRDESIELKSYREQFKQALSDDLNTSQAVATMWEMLKSDIPQSEKLTLLYEFDQVFGLGLKEFQEEKIPQEIITLAEQRKAAKDNKDFAKSDQLRKEIEERGYIIEDLSEGFKIKKK
jgi:cysteinyl-tRNA synthetase